MTTSIRARYRTPEISRYVEVSLNDFDDDQIVEYLRHRGYAVGGNGKPVHDEAGGPVPGEGPVLIDEDDLGRISTLAVCGQLDSARDHVLTIVERHIGRRLR